MGRRRPVIVWRRRLVVRGEPRVLVWRRRVLLGLLLLLLLLLLVLGTTFPDRVLRLQQPGRVGRASPLPGLAEQTRG